MSIFNVNLQRFQSQLLPNKIKVHKKGFLLFEIGIVLVLVSITSLIIINWHCRILLENSLCKSRIEAVFLGSHLTECFYISQDLNLKFKKIYNNKYHVEYKVYSDDKLHRFKYLNLKIMWIEQDMQNSLEFEAGKIL